MYAPGIPWQVLDVSTLAQPSQCLSHWLCALQQRDSPAGGWAQGRLRSAGGQVLSPELRKEHSLSWAQRKTKPNHTKTRAEPVADKSRTGKGDIGRGLSRGCFALRAGSAFPSRCLLCVCPESSIRVLGQGVPGAGTAPPSPPGHCHACAWLFGDCQILPTLGWDGLEELFFGVGSSGMFLPGETALQPFQHGHVKPQPSLTLPFSPSPQGCVANFSSLMGYQYHQKRCGKQLAEADKPVFS